MLHISVSLSVAAAKNGKNSEKSLPLTIEHACSADIPHLLFPSLSLLFAAGETRRHSQMSARSSIY